MIMWSLLKIGSQLTFCYHNDRCYQTVTFCLSIMELRKEKSRDAARSRRGKENFEFYELAKVSKVIYW